MRSKPIAYVLWVDAEEPEDLLYEIFGPFSDEDAAQEWANLVMDDLDAVQTTHISLHIMQASNPATIAAARQPREMLSRHPEDRRGA